MTDEHETIRNEERGCGFLEHGKGYLKSPSRSGAGTLPPFVRFDPPVPYLERAKFRGYEFFPGTAFELAVTSGTDVPTTGAEWFSPDGTEDPRLQDRVDGDEELEEALFEENDHSRNAIASVNGEDAGITRTDPSGEVWRHVARLTGSADGDHAGDISAFNTPDLFMHVGKCYYDTPEEFVEEVEEQGLSKAIPVSESQEPPRINPGKTRLFLVHPTAIDEDTAGVIGYVYLERSVYTEDKEGRFPGWASQMSGGREDMDLVHVGDQIHSDGTRATKVNGEWSEVEGSDYEPAGDETDENSDSSGSSTESIKPSDKPGRDVEAVGDDDYTADEDGRPKCYDCESRIDEFEDNGNGSPVCPECGGNPLPPVGSSDDETTEDTETTTTETTEDTDDGPRTDLFDEISAVAVLRPDYCPDCEAKLSRESMHTSEYGNVEVRVCESCDWYNANMVSAGLTELELREENSYNDLRSLASDRGLSTGRNPSADDLVHLLLDDMGAL